MKKNKIDETLFQNNIKEKSKKYNFKDFCKIVSSNYLNENENQKYNKIYLKNIDLYKYKNIKYIPNLKSIKKKYEKELKIVKYLDLSLKSNINKINKEIKNFLTIGKKYRISKLKCYYLSNNTLKRKNILFSYGESIFSLKIFNNIKKEYKNKIFIFTSFINLNLVDKKDLIIKLFKYNSMSNILNIKKNLEIDKNFRFKEIISNPMDKNIFFKKDKLKDLIDHDYLFIESRSLPKEERINIIFLRKINKYVKRFDNEKKTLLNISKMKHVSNKLLFLFKKLDKNHTFLDKKHFNSLILIKGNKMAFNNLEKNVMFFNNNLDMCLNFNVIMSYY